MTDKISRDQINLAGKPALKIYESPEIVEYGTLRDVTLAVATTSKTSDSGTGLTNKTS